MDEVIGSGVGRVRSAASGRQVLQEFDARAGPQSQPRDPETRALDVVEPFLLEAEVPALSGHGKPQEIAVEAEAPLGVRHDDGRVVDAEKEAGRRRLPARIALAGWEPDQLEVMAIGVLEVERPNPARRRVGHRQGLWSGRRVAHSGAAEDAVGLVHVAHHDGHVLEPVVVGPPIDGRGAALGGQVLGQFEHFAAKPEPGRQQARSEYAGQSLDIGSVRLAPFDQFETEHLGKEPDAPIEVGHRKADVRDRDATCGQPFVRLLPGGRAGGAERRPQQDGQDDGPPGHPSGSSSAGVGHRNLPIR